MKKILATLLLLTILTTIFAACAEDQPTVDSVSTSDVSTDDTVTKAATEASSESTTESTTDPTTETETETEPTVDTGELDFRDPSAAGGSPIELPEIPLT